MFWSLSIKSWTYGIENCPLHDFCYILLLRLRDTAREVCTQHSVSLIIVHLPRVNSAQVAQNHQDPPPGSRENPLRLLQAAAASVHALAGIVYEPKHKDMDIKPPEPPGGYLRRFHTTDGYYVNFYHTDYKRFEDYPFGLLNVVGYWAEAELFGGVVLFERGAGGSGVHCWCLAKPMLTDIRSLTLPFILKESAVLSSSLKNSSKISRV